MNGTILLVDDSPANALVYENYLNDNYKVQVAYSGREALSYYEKGDFSLVVLDIQLPDITGIDVLKKIRESDKDIPVVIITAHGSVDIALEAMKSGANDFLSKPFERARLEVTIKNLLKEHSLSQIVSRYERSCTRSNYARMVGQSLPMQSVYNIIDSAANSKATVFITGESGTGKELCAEAIHQTSQRRDKEFVPLNCAAIPNELLESEIFGHVKGAFTGASSARQGAAERADGGTLFLDEIGEMPLELQSKLLRFIQTGKFQPVGSNKEISTDIRFVCATNRDPLEEVKNGRFREDLYYRLHVIPIEMPPLRSRGDDILLIAQALLNEFNTMESKHFKGFSAEVEAIFSHYEWPGNVRELSNVLRNVIVLNDSDEISRKMLPSPLNSNELSMHSSLPKPEQSISTGSSQKKELGQPSFERDNLHNVGSSRDIEPLWLTEKRVIEQAIERCEGNIPRAAAFLEISASTIYRKKQQWESKLEKRKSYS